MSQVNVVMCAGFSPSARAVRKALRRTAEKTDIKVITPCPSCAGLTKHIEELRSLDPRRTLVVEGCDACCGTQSLLLHGVVPSRTVVVDKMFIVNEEMVNATEEKILVALKELGP